MGNQDEELLEVVKEISESEGISFKEAIKLSITTLRDECLRRKEWRDAGPAYCNAGCGHMNSGSGVKVSSPVIVDANKD